MNRVDLACRSSESTSFVSTADAQAMVALVSQACDPGIEMTVADRRDALVRGLAQLVGADRWICAIGQSRPENPADGPPFALFDGGWKDETERMAVLGVCMDQEIAGEVNRHTAAAWKDMQTRTWMRQDVWDDVAWRKTSAWRGITAVGLEHFLLSIFPMENLFYSVIGLHRKIGQPPFSERDRTIVHVIWQQVAWLHRQELDVPVGSDVVELTLRERQVLLLLLAGKSRKQAAASLGLSEHTIGDHTKGIYRKLSVRSRGELLSKFIPSRS